MALLQRFYERYDFCASAEIIDSSGAHLSSKVTNISFGGCRLLTNGTLPIGSEITVKIHSNDEDFEAPGKVIHSNNDEAGVIFGNIEPRALFVLQKWLHEARYIQSMNERL